MLRIWKFRHRYAWDLTKVTNPEHKRVIQDALNACDFPFSRIRRNTRKRVPVEVKDLSRWNASVAAAKGHAHAHDEEGNEAHILAVPRRGALGLYWLPTAEHPAGRVEVEQSIMGNAPLAQEVFLAEAAHAVDYGAVSEADREALMALFEHSHIGHEHPGWFEEHGEQDYWAWRGERWMGLFMAAFAPTLQRPLENSQPWHWTYTDAAAAEVRRILKVR